MNWRLQVEIKKRFGTQARFAEFLGVSESQVSKVLSGKRSLSPKEKRQWASALNRPLESGANSEERKVQLCE